MDFRYTIKSPSYSVPLSDLTVCDNPKVQVIRRWNQAAALVLLSASVGSATRYLVKASTPRNTEISPFGPGGVILGNESTTHSPKGRAPF